MKPILFNFYFNTNEIISFSVFNCKIIECIFTPFHIYTAHFINNKIE